MLLNATLPKWKQWLKNMQEILTWTLIFNKYFTLKLKHVAVLNLVFFKKKFNPNFYYYKIIYDWLAILVK